MQVKLVSPVEVACSEAQFLTLQGIELIATGLIVNNGQKHTQIALIDVTPEVESGQLDNKNLRLVETFLRTHQKEILDQVNQVVTVGQQAFAAGTA
jgi:hypothetical protein